MTQKHLTPHLVNQLDNLYLKAKLIVEGFMSGLHKSPFHGFSIEFSEHRPYQIGDETKNIDWKLWSKTDKYYIKRFEEETNLLCHIFLDSSKSMEFKSNTNITKFNYAKILAAALSYLIIQQKDALGLYIFDSKIKTTISPKSSKSHLNTVLSVLEQVKSEHDTNISDILHTGADKIQKKGLIILISDLLDEPKKVVESLKHFKYNKNEVLVFHIMDEQEIILDYNDRIMFEDLETKEQIRTNPWQIKESYKKEVEKYLRYYRTECSLNKIEYNLLLTKDNIESALSNFLNKRKKSF